MENKSSENLYVPAKEHRKNVTRQLSLSILVAVLGMFQFGYNTSVINAPQTVVEDFYNQTYYDRNGKAMSESSIGLLWGFTVAVFAVGGMVGAVGGAWWANKFGRKGGMMWNSGFGVLAGILMGFSKMAASYEMIIIGRFFVGLNCGLYTGLVPIYISEVAPQAIRGGVGTLNQLAVTVGMLVGQVFGLTELLGTESLWPVLVGLAAVPPILQLATLPLIPESPRYLLITKGQEKQAEDGLIKLRQSSNVRDEIDEMYLEANMGDGEDNEMYSLKKVLTSPALRLPLFISIVMHLSQQLSGINCIFYYSVSLFQNVGLTEEEAKYANLGVGCIMVVMTLVSVPLMDRAGRKTLHLMGLTGMCVLSVLFTIAYHFALKTDEVWLQYLTIVSALVIVVFFAIGPGSIPWMIVAELFSQGPRPMAVNIGVLVNWFGNFVVGQTFPPLQNALKEFVFLPFTFFLIFFIIWLFIYLPETKGKSFAEISDIFNKSSRSPSINKHSSVTHM